MSLSKVGHQGRVISDVELRFSQDGKGSCRFRFVSANRMPDPDNPGKWIDNPKAQWYTTVKAFGNLAENFADKFKPGDPIVLWGHEITETWQDASGANKSANVFIAEDGGPSLFFPMHSKGTQPAQERPQQASTTAPVTQPAPAPSGSPVGTDEWVF